MKKLFLALLLIISFSYASAQTISVVKGTFDAGVSFYTGLQTLDTNQATVYYTQYFDVTGIDAQTIYLTYDYITAGNTDDSVLVYIQGYFNSGTSAMVLGCDSLYLVGSTASSVKQLTLSISGFAPMYRIRYKNYNAILDVEPNAAGTLKLNLYAKAVDAVYKWNKSWY